MVPPSGVLSTGMKKTPTLNSNDKEKLMTIVVSFIERTKLLGVPNLGTELEKERKCERSQLRFNGLV